MKRNLQEYKDLYPKEQKFFDTNFAIKSLDNNGIFTGYASVFDNIDYHSDIIDRGAFDTTLKNKQFNDIKILWQHDPQIIIGKIKNLYRDNKGLVLQAELFLELEKAKEAYLLLKKGVISGLSIGFSIKKYLKTKGEARRIIKDLKLWEISLVTFPANPEAQIYNVKGNSYLAVMQQNLDKAFTAISNLCN